MDFQQIRDTLGQMEGDYQAKTEITATILQVKPVEYSKQSGKPGQSLYVQLDSGEKDWIKFIGKNVADSPLDYNAEKKQYLFRVWPFKADQAPKASLYCWIQRQVPSQGGSQAPQTTKAGQGVDITAQFLKLANRFVDAIEHITHGNATFEPEARPTQESGPNPDYVGDDPPPPDDEDIPF